MAASQYEPIPFPALDGGPAGVTADQARAHLLQSAQAGLVWPSEWALPGPISAVLDALVLWRRAWLEYQESPGEDKAGRELARDALAAADVADDDLAALVDGLIAWRQAEDAKAGKLAARLARKADSRGDSAD